MCTELKNPPAHLPELELLCDCRRKRLIMVIGIVAGRLALLPHRHHLPHHRLVLLLTLHLRRLVLLLALDHRLVLLLALHYLLGLLLLAPNPVLLLRLDQKLQLPNTRGQRDIAVANVGGCADPLEGNGDHLARLRRQRHALLFRPSPVVAMCASPILQSDRTHLRLVPLQEMLKRLPARHLVPLQALAHEEEQLPG